MEKEIIRQRTDWKVELDRSEIEHIVRMYLEAQHGIKFNEPEVEWVLGGSECIDDERFIVHKAIFTNAEANEA